MKVESHGLLRTGCDEVSLHKVLTKYIGQQFLKLLSRDCAIDHGVDTRELQLLSGGVMVGSQSSKSKARMTAQLVDAMCANAYKCPGHASIHVTWQNFLECVVS